MAEAKNYAPLYKKWTRASTSNYFCSVGYPWFKADKIGIEIGETSGGGLKSATRVFVAGHTFASWLHHFVMDADARIQDGKLFQQYGGAMVEGQPVSRVLDVTAHKDKDNQLSGRHVVRVAHLEGVRTDTGAFMPKRPQKVLSSNSIQLNYGELIELSYRLDACYSGYYAAMFLGHADDIVTPTEDVHDREPEPDHGSSESAREPQPGELF